MPDLIFGESFQGQGYLPHCFFLDEVLLGLLIELLHQGSDFVLCRGHYFYQLDLFFQGLRQVELGTEQYDMPVRLVLSV